jgi:hypothetical protein
MGQGPRDPFNVSTKKQRLSQAPKELLSCLQFGNLCFPFSMLSL